MERGSSRTMCSKRRRRAAACRSRRQRTETAMLRSAVVGAHGRGLPVRLLTWGLMLLLSTLSSSVGAQAPLPSAFDDLIPDLAAKVASALPAGAQVSLTVETGVEGEDARTIRARMTTLLAARGLRIADATTGIAAVTIGCGRNFRER